jgi:hypothetical protein
MKQIKYFFPLLISIIFLQLNGCDELNSIPLNIPVTITFDNQTGSNVTFDSGIYCLDSESDTYKEYRDKIQSLTFLQAAYRTTSNSNPSVQGDISVTIYNGSKQVLASFKISNIKPQDYIKTPLIIQLNQAQIQKINSSLTGSTCLQAVVEITSLNGTTTISGAVDLVLQADTKL